MRYGVTAFAYPDPDLKAAACGVADVLKEEVYTSPASLLETVKATLTLNGIAGLDAFLRNGNVDLSGAHGVVLRFVPIN